MSRKLIAVVAILLSCGGVRGGYRPPAPPQAPPVRSECECAVTGVCICGADCRCPNCPNGCSCRARDITKLTYKEARERAVREGKTLVCWVGGMRCPKCVADLTDMVHVCLDSFEGDSSPHVQVGVYRDGQLWRAGTCHGPVSTTDIRYLAQPRSAPAADYVAAPVVQQYQPAYYPPAFAPATLGSFGGFGWSGGGGFGGCAGAGGG